MTTVLVAGGTGMLGSGIAGHLLEQPDVTVRILARQGWNHDSNKRARLEPLLTAGAVVSVGDVTQPATLDAATRGVDAVVSALQGRDGVIVAGQIALAEAAVANGVRRFLPSDFAIDLFRAPAGAPQFDARKKADLAIDAMDIDVFHVLNGGFMDMMLDPAHPQLVNIAEGKVSYWGTGDEPFDLTTIDDTATFAARLATDPSARPGIHTISGARVTFNGIARELQAVTGVSMKPVVWGNIEQLREEIDAKGGSWDALMEWYFLAMLTTPPLEPTATHDSDFRPIDLHSYLSKAYGHPSPN